MAEPWPEFWTTVLGSLVAAVIAAAVLLMAAAPAVRKAVNRALHQLLSQPPDHTPAQVMLSLRATPPDRVLFISQRAHTGDVPLHPMGSKRPSAGLEALNFRAAQTARRPLPGHRPVGTRVILGPARARPLMLALPVWIAPMGYGLALSRQAKLALAMGSALAGTAIGSGEGAFLPEEAALAKYWVYQVGRAAWNQREDLIRQADMVEIHGGQGAEFQAPITKPQPILGPDAAEKMRLPPGKPAEIPAGLNWHGRPVELPELVDRVRRLNPRVPLAVKLGAHGNLEEDIDMALAAGVDVISVDGQEAGTGDAPMGLNEAFGVDLVPAIHRAHRHLLRRRVRDRVNLVVSGGIRSAADVLRCLALGADAAGIGSAALMALTHEEITQAPPGSPPLDLVSHGSPQRERLRIFQAAHHVHNYLQSLGREMQLLARSMGHSHVGDVSPADLSTPDPVVAHHLGVQLHWERSPERLPPLLSRSRSAADAIRDRAQRVETMITHWSGAPPLIVYPPGGRIGRPPGPR